MKLIEKPYKHLIKETFFPQNLFQILSDFVANSQWTYFDDERFPQYTINRNFVEDFFLINVETKEYFSYLFSEQFINSLKAPFGLNLNQCVSISFHKLIKSNFNIIHNDFNPNGEKLRIVCYLSEPDSYLGGELNLYLIHNLDIPYISYKLGANTAFAFEMNQQSLHSVSKVESGERICVVITYQ